MKDIKLERILVPVSLCGDGEDALKQALYFKKKLASKITLIHITPSASNLRRIVHTELNKRLQARAMVRLIRFAKIHFKGRIPEDVELRVEIGQHVPVIIEVANKENFNLLIIRKSDRIEGLSGKLKKHSADRIVRECHCPVLSLKDRWTYRGLRTVLVPVDIRRQSRNLLLWSIFLGKTLGVRISFISVLTVNVELKKSLAYKKAKLLERSIRAEGIDCESRMFENQEGTKMDAFLQYAKNEKADLVLIQGSQDILFGDNQGENYASKLLHDSIKPVFRLGSGNEGFFKDLLGANVPISLQSEMTNQKEVTIA